MDCQGLSIDMSATKTFCLSITTRWKNGNYSKHVWLENGFWWSGIPSFMCLKLDRLVLTNNDNYFWVGKHKKSWLPVVFTMQLVVIALITVTVFLRTQMKIDMFHADYYMTSLFYALIRHVCNGVEELSLTSSRLPVFYKQRDFYLYPAWTYSIPAVILKVPFSLTDAFVWTAITYYAIGYSPEPERWALQFLN